MDCSQKHCNIFLACLVEIVRRLEKTNVYNWYQIEHYSQLSLFTRLKCGWRLVPFVWHIFFLFWLHIYIIDLMERNPFVKNQEEKKCRSWYPESTDLVCLWTEVFPLQQRQTKAATNISGFSLLLKDLWPFGFMILPSWTNLDFQIYSISCIALPIPTNRVQPFENKVVASDNNSIFFFGGLNSWSPHYNAYMKNVVSDMAVWQSVYYLNFNTIHLLCEKVKNWQILTM